MFYAWKRYEQIEGGNVKHRLYIPGALLMGLLSAQVLATIHVYLSNMALWQTTGTLLEAGYLAIPNARIAEDLRSVSTAAAGGVFFTLSLGAALTMVSFCVVWLWDRILHRNPKAFRWIIGFWVICLIMINLSGLNIAACAYIILIPAVTWVTASLMMPSRSTSGVLRLSFLPVLLFVVLTILWSNILDRNIFINIRDYLLLSNPVGQRINDFYYKYTLFPAETFKAVGQKQIRSCNLDEVLDQSLTARLEKTLRYYDYLYISGADRVDLSLETSENGDRLLMKGQGKVVVEISSGDFFKNPGDVLKDFSEKCDSNRLFRRLVFFSLLIGFPLILYAMIYSLLYLILGLFFSHGMSMVLTTVLCFGIGVSMLIPVSKGSAGIPPEKELTQLFLTGSLGERVSVLRRIWEDKKEVGEIEGFEKLVNSPHLAERYWLTRSLTYSKHRAAQGMLYALINDPSPNIVCQAFGALGQRRERGAIKMIIDRIKTSTHWYEQHYGYRALRSLGWLQQRSKQHSF